MTIEKEKKKKKTLNAKGNFGKTRNFVNISTNVRLIKITKIALTVTQI